MARPDQQIPVFVNGSAGGARDAPAALAQRLAAAGVRAELRVVRPSELANAVARAVNEGARIIGVAGGDGTISTAAGLLAGTAVVLAPIPLGTLNHFARRLGLVDVDVAARAIAAGRTLRIAVGRAGERVFVNNASCGVYPHLVRHRERLRRWLGKWPAAAVAAVRVLLGLRRMHVTLATPEAELQRDVAGVWLGLGGGSFELPSEARLKEHARVLEIVLPHARTRAGLLRLAGRVLWRLLRGRRPRSAGLEILHAPTCELAAPRPVDVALDGEPARMPSPIRFRLDAAALAVVVAEDLELE